MNLQQQKCGHCWHDTDTTAPEKPGEYQQVCCYCKLPRWRPKPVKLSAGHGQHVPTQKANK